MKPNCCRNLLLLMSNRAVCNEVRFYHAKHLRMSKMYPGVSAGSDPDTGDSVTVNDGDTDCNSLKVMLQNRLIHGGAAGTYTLLPPLTRSLEKLVKVIDEEMQNIGAQKVAMPCLAPASIWKKSGRWTVMGSELFKLQDRVGKDMCLAPTHEEAITSLVGSEALLPSTKLPLRLYQIGRKFRDEMRPKHGLLRGREFEMKDLYTFDLGPEEAEETYQEVCQAYSEIFNRLQLDAIKVEADTGAMGGSKSHEYHLQSDIGEDKLLQCQKCGKCVNEELDISSEGDSAVHCSEPSCGGTCKKITGIEVAHAFILGKKYSNLFKARVWNTTLSAPLDLSMGCYGIGVTRLLAAAVEILSTGTDLKWPPILAPHQICIISQQTGHFFSESLAIAQSLQEDLLNMPGLHNEVVLDDRFKYSIGKRMKLCCQAGFPHLVIVGKKVQENPPLLEYHNVNTGEVHLCTREEVLGRLSQIKTIQL